MHFDVVAHPLQTFRREALARRQRRAPNKR
jgi:hypothetical protein